MSEHAKLSPSSAHRWIPCPGSIMLSEGIPNKTNEYAEYGTAGHELAERCLSLGESAKYYKGEVLNKSDNFRDGFLVDDEMIEAVQLYIDYCRGLPGENFFVEQRVDYSHWVEDGFGTSDYIKFSEQDRHLFNVDLKMGKGVKVFAKENPQGIIYTAGVLNGLDPVFDFQRQDRVTIVIVQPRLDHIDEWETTVGWVLDYMQDIVAPAANRVKAKDPIFTPGEKQCRFCLARNKCNALKEHNLGHAMQVFGDIPTEGEIQLKDAHSMTVEELAELLPVTNTLINWAKGLHGYAQELIEQGVAVPGYKLVRGKAGNRKWRDDEDVERTLSDMRVKKGDMFTKKLLSPPQMCKMINNLGRKPETIAHLWTQPEGKITLAHDTDEREEIVLSSVDLFGAIPES